MLPRGPEQLQMLQLIGGYSTNSQSEQLDENSCKCFTWASPMHGCQPAVYWQYSTVLVYAVWCSAVFFFSTKEQKISFFKMNNLLGIDACFECQNDAVSKILRVTNRQTNITVTLCACAEGYLLR